MTEVQQLRRPIVVVGYALEQGTGVCVALGDHASVVPPLVRVELERRIARKSISRLVALGCGLLVRGPGGDVLNSL